MPFGLTNAPSTFQSLMNEQHNLFLKRSKCVFEEDHVRYLGHIVHDHGVSIDADKVQVVADWPTPTSPTSLRGFLGLAGFYRRFIKGYGVLAAPLTNLLCKNAFDWSQEAAQAFEELKRALTTTPLLSLLDVSLPFVVECDASCSGIGAVLQQGLHPIAFFSKKLADRHLKLPAYERELIGLS
ncbi:uncharacterized protein LOC116030899 [Ipomoea triloba]|uniref:uncharacterized protein LOC116030899 n=1 Tax=Ipomoea triloba TaxID=35885 RepID=UPI00125D578C|nr:uncharacterized protein LOC116030899 [Ipomoea triloba]